MFGIVKEIVTLVLAHQLNGDTFGIINLVGLHLCLLGIGTHGIVKAMSITTKTDESPIKDSSTSRLSTKSMTDEATSCLLRDDDDDDN